MRSAARLVLLLLALAPVLTGCGTGGDRAAARGAVERFVTALAAGDGARACAELGAETVAQLVERERAPCRRAVGELGLGPAAITRVQVYVTSAKVDLGDGESAFLDRAPGGWKIAAAGCRPQGKPADRPFDCELEA